MSGDSQARQMCIRDSFIIHPCPVSKILAVLTLAVLRNNINKNISAVKDSSANIREQTKTKVKQFMKVQMTFSKQIVGHTVPNNID